MYERTTALWKGRGFDRTSWLLPQVEPACLPWMTVSGEYEGDTDTIGSAIRCNTAQAAERKTL